MNKISIRFISIHRQHAKTDNYALTAAKRTVLWIGGTVIPKWRNSLHCTGDGGSIGNIDVDFGMEILVPDSDSQAGDGALSELSPLRNHYLDH